MTPDPSGAVTPASERIAVAVCTFRRVDQLTALLPLLAYQATTVTPAADVIVVDNDPDASAAAAVALHPEIRYVHEPRPGIAAGRNAALDAAADHDALVFLDDDEVPASGWLDDLVGAWRRWRSTAVAGPSVPTFTTPVPPWVAASETFRRRRRLTGDCVSGASTANLLLDVAAVARLGVRFDGRFGLTGGEDTVFTRTLVARGGEIRWCDEAEVVSPVAPERLTRRWVLRRSFRNGTTWSAMELVLVRPGAAVGTRAVLLVKALVNTARTAPTLAWATLTRDVELHAVAACRLAGQLGLAYGAVGGTLQEYGRRPRTLRARVGAGT